MSISFFERHESSQGLFLQCLETWSNTQSIETAFKVRHGVLGFRVHEVKSYCHRGSHMTRNVESEPVLREMEMRYNVMAVSLR